MMRKVFALAVVLVPLLGTAAAVADGGGLDPARQNSPFYDNTLIYTDRITDLQTSIYFGRFGDIDKYVPCDFEYGRWWTGDDATLCLRYDEDEQSTACLKPKFRGEAVTFSEPEGGGVVLTAKLLKGNKLPFG